MANESKSPLFQRVQAAIKDTVEQNAEAGSFGSIGRYARRKQLEKQGKFQDEAPMTFKRQVSNDFRQQISQRFGALGRAVANVQTQKNQTDQQVQRTKETVQSLEETTKAQYTNLKQQSSNINRNIRTLATRVSSLEDKIEDMMLSQERVEITLNRLLYKKDAGSQTIDLRTNDNRDDTIVKKSGEGAGLLSLFLGRGRGAAAGAAGAARGASATGGLGAAAAGAAGVGVGAAVAGAAATNTFTNASSPTNPNNADLPAPGARPMSASGLPPGLTHASSPYGGGPSASGNAATNEAMQFFQSKGWSKEQAAGIVGNLQVESGNFSPTVISGAKKGDGGRAVGIAQWHPDRQATFQRVIGKPIEGSTLKDQLEFVNWELNNTEKRAGNILRTMTDAAAAAAAVDQYYERSSGAHRSQRISNATSLAGGSGGAMSQGGQPAGRPSSATGMTGAQRWQAQTPRNSYGIPTQTMSGVLPEYPSMTRGGGVDTQPEAPQNQEGYRSPSQEFGGMPNRSQRPDNATGGNERNGMTTIKTPGGKSFTVASEYAKNFEGFVNELEGSGYKINSIGGYANRTTASGGFSWHSKGMAIDINPSQNPHTFPGSPNYGKTDMPANIGAMAAKYGLGWGGNWNSSKDTMHFSMGGSEGGSSNEARGGQMAGGGEMEGRPGASSGSMRTAMAPGLGGMPGMGMRGGSPLGMVGGMVGSMLGGRGGPMGSMLGGVLGSTLGNLVTPNITSGYDMNSRSSNVDINNMRRNNATIVAPMGGGSTNHTTPSARSMSGSGYMPTAGATGKFAEVVGAGIVGALVESLGSNSVSVNRKQFR